MSSLSPVIHAMRLDGHGNGLLLNDDEISTAGHDGNLTWLHLDAGNPDTGKWLSREVDYLDDIVLDALLVEETRPRFAEHNNGILLILRGVNLNENSEPEDMVSVRMWIDEHRIISMRHRRLKAIMDIREKLEGGQGPTNSGDFITMLSARLFERMEPVLLDLDERLDGLEEKVMQEPDAGDRHGITYTRRRAIILRRYIAPQRDAIGALKECHETWLTQVHRRQLQNTQDRIIRYIEELDATRERGQIIKDELSNALSDRMNKNLYMLSVIAAIFLPLGFLTGLLGINVGGIPGSGDPGAFAVFCFLLIGVVFLQILLFKRFKWF